MQRYGLYVISQDLLIKVLFMKQIKAHLFINMQYRYLQQERFSVDCSEEVLHKYCVTLHYILRLNLLLWLH